MPAKIIYKLVETEEEKEKVFSLRYQGYCLEWGWLNPQNYTDGKEKDEWDEHAFIFGAFQNNEIVGTLRLIPIMRGNFYSGKFVDFPKEISQNQCLEVSRLYVAQKNRAHNAKVMFELVKIAQKFCLQKGYPYWFFFMRENVEKILTHFGWSMNFLDDYMEIRLNEDSPNSVMLRPAILWLKDESIKFP